MAPPVEKGKKIAPLAIKVNAPEKEKLIKVTGTTSGKRTKTLAPLVIKNKCWHHQLYRLISGTTRNDDSQLEWFCAIFFISCL